MNLAGNTFNTGAWTTRGFKVSWLCMLASLVVLVTSPACVTSRIVGSDIKSEDSLTRQEEAVLMAEAKGLWTTRHKKADLMAALNRLERVAKSNPDNYEAQMLTCRGYYLLADSHTQEMEQKKKYWELGAAYGERAMATNTEFRRLTSEGAAMEQALEALTKREIDAVYWTAVNLGKWSKNAGIAAILRYKTRVKAMINRIEKLDPNYYYGAIHRYWGTYYAVAPGFAGGSMEKSLESFQKSFELANAYLGSHVLFAENYATRAGDKELFKKTLQRVLKAESGVLPDVEPENILEKRKAEEMLKNMDNYF